MNVFEKIIKKVLCIYYIKRYGFKHIRAVSWVNLIYNDWLKKNPNSDLPLKTKLWLTKNGFGFSRYKMQSLTKNNISLFLSDFDYWRIMPIDCRFYHWINDKLTIRYILSEFKEFLPEYYCNLDKNGNIILLPDSPLKIVEDNYLIELVKIKKIIAMKPTAGAEGLGFIKFTYESGSFFINDIKMEEDELISFFKSLKNYLVTEYIIQCKEHAKVCSLSACTLRINTIKEVGEYPFILHSFARFGTKKSGAVSNLMSGGVSIGYDSDTGLYSDTFLSACGQKIEFFKEHPDSHISLKGETLPNYRLIKEKILEIHNYLSQIPYMGFDVIVTDNGFKICEINSAPSVSYSQMMCYPIYTNKKAAAFFDKRLKGKRRNV